MSLAATCLGYPRIGIARELKKGLESFWAKRSSAQELLSVAAELRRRHWLEMKGLGIDPVPVGDFSLYDSMLDFSLTVGAIPERYRKIADPLTRYFAMARGQQNRSRTGARDGAHGTVESFDVAALEMTKWFDTNYHYIVPELAREQRFQLDASRLLTEIDEARALGVEPRPVIPGPVSFLLLSKRAPDAQDKSTIGLLDALLPIYAQLFEQLAAKSVGWVQIDEPCLVLDLDAATARAYQRALTFLTACALRPKLLIATYFGPLNENLQLLTQAACDGLHVDLVRAPEQLDSVLLGLDPKTSLSVGVVDGRNIWRTDLDAALRLVNRAVNALGPERVLVAPSCSLLHVPIDVKTETRLPAELHSWLAFAIQKLEEVRLLADAAGAGAPLSGEPTRPPHEARFEAARRALLSRKTSPSTKNQRVRERVAALNPRGFSRASSFGERAAKQKARFKLPVLPTTSIGSFPQTREVRQMRAAWRAGKLKDAEYQAFLETETQRCVEVQENLGLDVLVHGEFERSDMVEYFGEKLEGYAFTDNGWVQSYGSRCVKPPIAYGDIYRKGPMTVAWARYAQSLTNKPLKGMLTGPVTILKWSFVRDDQPPSATCMQIALALRDEVADLESAGISMIQVDEPAFREGLPLRKADFNEYLGWAVDAFRVVTSSVRDETQIHTHMCYSEFGDILPAIAAMDADVLSIEASRSNMELLSEFEHFRYPNQIGPGVYDIHSPRVPTTEEMTQLIERAAQAIAVERLWVNPDCGLKTRTWAEVQAALEHMVAAAHTVRRRLSEKRARG